MTKETYFLCLLSFMSLTICSSAGTCISNDTVIQDGNTFFPNNCTSCTCLNGQLNCTEQTCPQINCSFNEYMGDGECCPICFPRQVIDPPYHFLPISCHVNGITVKHGTTFPRDACTNCTCYNGGLGCISKTCPLIMCPQGSHLVTNPGDCCVTCQPQPKPVSCRGRSTVRMGCKRCFCVRGKFVCGLDPTLQCVSSGDGGEKTDSSLLITAVRCAEGTTKVTDCMSCTCGDGEFWCFFNATLCGMPGHELPEDVAEELEMVNILTLKVSSQLKGNVDGELMEQVDQFLTDTNTNGVQVLSIETTSLDKEKTEVEMEVQYRRRDSDSLSEALQPQQPEQEQNHRPSSSESFSPLPLHAQLGRQTRDAEGAPVGASSIGMSSVLLTVVSMCGTLLFILFIVACVVVIVVVLRKNKSSPGKQLEV